MLIHQPSKSLFSIIYLLLPALSGFSLAAGQRIPAAREVPKSTAQVQQSLPVYEGQRVNTVELAGRPDLDVASLTHLLVQKPGTKFSQAKINESVAALERTGKFKSVETEVRPEADGVRILFVLHPAIYFGIYRFPGAENHFTYSRLLQVANYPPRGAYTPVDVQEAQASVEKFLQRTGYFQAKVNTEIQTDRVHGLANVIFHVDLGRRAKFGNVDIAGTSPRESKRLADNLHSWMARLRGSAIRPGKKYKLHTIQNASQYLEGSLMKQKHLEAKVKLNGAEYDPATNRADIHYKVDPGPVINVDVQGAHLWSWTKHKLLPVYAQIGIDPELIQEGRQNLVSYFQSKGFFNVNVTAEVTQGPSGENIIYQITKGPRHEVDGVKIVGNKIIGEDRLVRQIAVKKAHWWFFSHGDYSDKLLKTSVDNLSLVYKAEGFSSVQVTPKVNTHGGDIVVTFVVNEGPRDIVESLSLVGNTVPVSKLAPKGLKLSPGKPYSQKLADEDRNEIIANYLRSGYLNATFRETAAPVGNDKHHLRITYEISEGPQVITESVVTLGRKVTRQSLITKSVKIPVGKPLREDQMLLSENELYKLGIFDWAEIDPRRQITTQHDEEVLIKVHEAKRNVMTYGVGFEVINRGGSVPSGTVAVPGVPPVGLPSNFVTSQKTFWGPRGTFEYTRKNVLGRAQSLSFATLAARLDQRSSASYVDPKFFGSSWSSNLAFTGEHDSENPIFTFLQGQAGYQFQRPVSSDKTQNVFLSYTLRETKLTNLLIPDLVPPSDLRVRLSTVSGTYTRDTRDNPIDAHKGIYETLEIDLNPEFLGSNVSFARLLGQTAYYKNIGAGIIYANSVRLGLEQPFNGSHVPISETFFTGGGSTLRGFPLNGAGPQRTITACGNPADISTCAPITVPVGGNELFIVNSELRVPVPIKKGFGVVAFYDGGNVFPRIGFHDFTADYSNSVGFGFRYATPVGPIRFDIGHNLNAPPGISSTQYFVTIGQAF
jgi:outer membrane protein insertion porin family